MSVKELKEELHLSGADMLNVFFASNSVREELAGAATWPWAKEALTHQGEWGTARMLFWTISPLYFLLYIIEVLFSHFESLPAPPFLASPLKKWKHFWNKHTWENWTILSSNCLWTKYYNWFYLKRHFSGHYLNSQTPNRSADSD